jgi:hypothetical protein
VGKSGPSKFLTWSAIFGTLRPLIYLIRLSLQEISQTKQRPIVRQTYGKEEFGKNASGSMASEMISDYIAHMDYLHYDPAEYGHVEQVKVWPYSAFTNWLTVRSIRKTGAVIRLNLRLVKGFKTCDILRGANAALVDSIGLVSVDSSL